MDTEKFLTEFQDYLAPKLDVYEQAIYLYLVRHSRLIGKDETTVGFKSARKQLAFGIGKAGTPPSEGVCYEKVKSLDGKGYIKVLGTEHSGTRIHPYLPHEINGLIQAEKQEALQTLEEMDFFEVPENRELILEREGNKCFYCLTALNTNNYVIEHVLSRPQGDNSYRNVVASCRQCNNRKGSSDAQDYCRTLYRAGFITSTEFEERLSHLERLRNGDLKPELTAANKSPHRISGKSGSQ